MKADTGIGEFVMSKRVSTDADWALLFAKLSRQYETYAHKKIM